MRDYRRRHESLAGMILLTMGLFGLASCEGRKPSSEGVPIPSTNKAPVEVSLTVSHIKEAANGDLMGQLDILNLSPMSVLVAIPEMGLSYEVLDPDLKRKLGGSGWAVPDDSTHFRLLQGKDHGPGISLGGVYTEEEVVLIPAETYKECRAVYQKSGKPWKVSVTVEVRYVRSAEGIRDAHAGVLRFPVATYDSAWATGGAVLMSDITNK